MRRSSCQWPCRRQRTWKSPSSEKQWPYWLLPCVLQFEPQSPNCTSIKVCRKWVSAQSRKGTQKCAKSAKSALVRTFWFFSFSFLDLAEAPCLAHLNVSFAVLWLDLNAQLLLANQGSQQQEKLNSGRFIKGGLMEKGYTHPVASALSLHTARPAAVLPHKCDIPLHVKGWPNCAGQLAMLASTVSVLAVGSSSYSHPGHHGIYVVTLYLLTRAQVTPCLNLPRNVICRSICWPGVSDILYFCPSWVLLNLGYVQHVPGEIISVESTKE